MLEILPEHWATLHLGLIFCLTLTQLLVVYVLSEHHAPPAGLGLFTVYFMASLLGWIVLALQQGSSAPMPLDVPAVASIINGYLLFLAAGQRSGNYAGRFLLGTVCLAGCLSVFFLTPRSMYMLQSGLTGVFFASTGLLFAQRARNRHNIGDMIIALAALLMLASASFTCWQIFAADDLQLARVVSFGAHTWTFTLISIGFLASVLLDYRKHLSHLATEDALTGLLNRRGMEAALRVSLARANREASQTTAIMVDIDHLKTINDNFGHETGDRVIRRIAANLSRLCRSSDVLARVDGEEFLLVLPDTDAANARILAERICSTLGAQPLLIGQQPIPVTVSLGVATKRGAVDLDELGQEADNAMYLAKRGGGNRVAAVDSMPVHFSNAPTAT